MNTLNLVIAITFGDLAAPSRAVSGWNTVVVETPALALRNPGGPVGM